ncbi:valine--tRNA ligase [Patella vulgata]|uniref:valine--tRNA ligase n=1 Tax=Patella vulgata TaxID=6465 RepID=UPI0024A924D4|nr:valine--tRNA ligase [Patella vulgata]
MAEQATQVNRVISPLQEEEVWVSGRSESEAREKAGRKFGIPTNEVTLEQDEDVLDTWFSSALFPFAVHGWPNQADDLYDFYPISLLETGNDILFFWVARMVMFGQRLTGKLPFKQILLHGLLKDSVGRKMSKSLGNVVDPIDVIQGLPLQEMQTQLKQSNLDEKEIKKALESQRREFPQGLPECGADALRFTLCSYDFKAGEISLDVAHVKSYRHFCNKIWQGFRFVADKLGNDFKPEKLQNFDNRSYNAVDFWILSRLSHMIQSCDDHFRSYDLHHATRCLHTFWQSEFCDVYLENVKSVFIEGSEDDRLLKRQILFTCVETFLRALSPFMPFITEELYQRLPEKGDKSVSVCIAPYPQPHQYKWRDEDIEDEMKNVQVVINKVLSLRRFFNLTKTKADTYLRIKDSEMDVWNKYSSILKTLSRAGTFHIISDESDLPDTCCHSYINNNIHIYLNLQGVVKSTVEYQRLNQLKDKLKIELQNINQTIETDDGESKEILKKFTQQRYDKGVEVEFINNVLKVLNNLK